MRLISQITLPPPEDSIMERNLPEDPEADSKILQHVPWLAEDGNLTLAWSRQRGSMESFLYYLVAAVTKNRPVRCLLRRQHTADFLGGLMRSFAGLSFLDRHYLSTDQSREEELRAIYRKTEERIRSLDLGVEEIIGWNVEDVIEYCGHRNGELFDAVVIIDSLSSLTTAASAKWDISRAVIGARIRDWIDSIRSPVVLLDRMPPGAFHDDMYEPIAEYLDGDISIHQSKRHRIGNTMYNECDVCYHYHNCGASFAFYFDTRTGRYIDELPQAEPPSKAPDIPAPADIPF